MSSSTELHREELSVASVSQSSPHLISVITTGERGERCCWTRTRARTEKSCSEKLRCLVCCGKKRVEQIVLQSVADDEQCGECGRCVQV